MKGGEGVYRASCGMCAPGLGVGVPSVAPSLRVSCVKRMYVACVHTICGAQSACVMLSGLVRKSLSSVRAAFLRTTESVSRAVSTR